MADAHYTDEIWKDIPGWEGLYQASSLGRIKSLERRQPHRGGCAPARIQVRKARILRPGRHPKGYLIVALCATHIGRPPKTYRAHRLICEAFHGPCPEGHECAHNDGTRDNNAAANLRWATHAENIADKAIHREQASRLG